VLRDWGVRDAFERLTPEGVYPIIVDALGAGPLSIMVLYSLHFTHRPTHLDSVAPQELHVKRDEFLAMKYPSIQEEYWPVFIFRK
jgi:hypothetical protein